VRKRAVFRAHPCQQPFSKFRQPPKNIRAMSEKRVGKIALTLIDSVDRLSSDNINL
jgi:hypothetical protein